MKVGLLGGLALLCPTLTLAQGPLTTAFTYQGLLEDSGQPANGTYDFEFRLYDAPAGGAQVGSTLCADNIGVVEGRFSVSLDFGAQFTGSQRFLEIAVRPDAGMNCAAGGGYTTLLTRQALTAAPNAAYAISAGTATNAAQLNGQAASFYQNASNLTSGVLPSARLSGTYSNALTFSNASNSFTGSGAGLTSLNASNISSGTLADARLSTNVALLGANGVFTGIPAFNGGTSGSTAPFSVDSTFKVTNLNADLLDGLDSTAFAATSHTHDASAIASGTLADARLSSNIPRLNTVNNFTAGGSFSGNFGVGTTTPEGTLHVLRASAGPVTADANSVLVVEGSSHSYLTILSPDSTERGLLFGQPSNNVDGGILYNSGTPRGFQFRTGGNVTRMVIDSSGNVGIGTSSPGALLEARAADPQVRIRNTNDTGGGVLINTWGALQLGMFNPTATAWNTVPANGYRIVLAMDSAGRVGSATNTSGAAAFRNLLDDGSGNASFAGRVTATHDTTTSGTIQGTHTGTSGNQYAVFGLASATGTSSAVGVRGEARGSAGAGVYGIATHTTGQVYGVIGIAGSTNSFSAGVYGESATANAIYGYSAGGKALYGRSDNSYGVYAQTTTGGVALYGVRTSNNNRGWFGGAGEGGWAESTSGTGFVAKSATGSYALYAERNPGGSPSNVNRGWLGGAGEGAWAESDQGNGLVALSRGLNAAAVYCRNDGGGRALFADGVAAVRALDILGGADLAEPFDIDGDPEPGMVVCIDPDNPGRLRISRGAYDTTVAGIVSGARGLSPGMVMRDEKSEVAGGKHAVAMTGRVWCYADATDAEIRPGDRLTTSDIPGHAMRVSDDSRAPGAVIGKAMTPLPRGERGLVLVLVNLQ